MRYTGGLNGGSWLTALTGDLGHGIFDGACLVQNFENMNPVEHALDQAIQPLRQGRHRGPALSRLREMVGRPRPPQRRGDAVDRRQPLRRQQAGHRRDRHRATACRLDLRNIKSPIICFCSQGDDITPPQQALDWILDLYGSVDDIRANGQTIVYCVHDKIGHLGIFVSGGVAKKEHARSSPATSTSSTACRPASTRPC